MRDGVATGANGTSRQGNASHVVPRGPSVLWSLELQKLEPLTPATPCSGRPNTVNIHTDREYRIHNWLADIMADGSPSPAPAREPTRSVSRGRSPTRSPRRSASDRSRSPTPQRSRTRSVSRSRTRSPARSQSPRRNGRPSYTPDSRSRSRSSRGRSFTQSPSRRSTSPAPRSAKIVIEQLTKNVNEGHLREIFGSHGPIKDIKLPVNPVCKYKANDFIHNLPIHSQLGHPFTTCPLTLQSM
ncbi:hypothetical protein P171DRAFT_282545 [Karstenula rhodostoma CBS 690.94]|uniref:RRM domain-containing protein n=1 Tax=Karstenula rhodostoma CBS 690.94 TaxID=1392251 RepID=A0A9P4PK54_9PLEO|nr:hypothetical protein P171DRAFT_282545 [Karstenula rhodostoma CBS 690.94]